MYSAITNESSRGHARPLAKSWSNATVTLHAGGQLLLTACMYTTTKCTLHNQINYNNMMDVSRLLREAPKTVEEAGYIQGLKEKTFSQRCLPKQLPYLRIHVHSRSGTHFPTVPLNPSMRVCVKKSECAATWHTGVANKTSACPARTCTLSAIDAGVCTRGTTTGTS